MTEAELLEASTKCLDCGAPLIPCTCRPDCPGGMCSDSRCTSSRLYKEPTEAPRG